MAGSAFPESQSMEQSPLAAIWRYRWLILLLTLISGGIALLLALGLLPPRYEATASLVVADPKAATLFSSSQTAGRDAERYVADQKAILGSDAVADRASELLAADLETVPTSREITKNVKIITSSSNEIKVTYPAPNSESAVATVNAIIEAYGLLRAESAVRDSASAIDQLDQSISDIDTELANIETQLDTIREDSDWNELNAQYQAALDRIAEIQPQMQTASGSTLLAQQAELDALDQQLARLDGILRLADSQQTAVQLNGAQRAALDSQYDAAVNRLAEIQTSLATAEGQDFVALQAEMADLDQELERLRGIITIEDADPRLAQLDLQQSEALTRRRALAEERDRLLIDTRLLSGGISFSSPAKFALKANLYAPITILGAALGLLGASGLAYLLSIRRRRFVERAQPGWILQAELLAEVPNFLEEGVQTDTPVVDNPASATAEAYRFAATSLELQLTDRQDGRDRGADQVRTFLVTSAGPSDGKTVLVANLALAAARKGRKVLVIDADFGNQRLTELLTGKRSKGPGITEVVEAGLDLESALVELKRAGNIDLLSRGQRNVTAPDFFSLPATRAFLRKIGRTYNMVLIDGPPMLHIAYASILATYVDRIVTVVRHGSQVTQLEDLTQRLAMIRTPIAGYVYNAAPLRPELMLTEGSLKDVLGQEFVSDVPTTNGGN
jgi:succinoglycan biosynthesis transport protein ExoP